MKRVRINGDGRETGAASIAALLTELGLAKGTVLVEHNGTALRPDEWDDRPVADGDRIELMRLVAGG